MGGLAVSVGLSGRGRDGLEVPLSPSYRLIILNTGGVSPEDATSVLVSGICFSCLMGSGSRFSCLTGSIGLTGFAGSFLGTVSSFLGGLWVGLGFGDGVLSPSD